MAGRPGDGAGRYAVEIPGGIPQPPASLHDVLQAGRRHDDQGRRVPGAQRTEGGPPHPHRGAAQPVRRPDVDGSCRDADAGVAARAARVPRVPADAHQRRLSRTLDGSRRRDEEAAGVDRHERACTSATLRCSASRSCSASGGDSGAMSRSPNRRSTGRGSSGRRSRATSTPTARWPASISPPRRSTRRRTPRCRRRCCAAGCTAQQHGA